MILCYHGVVSQEHKDRFGYENTVSAGEFRQQLEFIRRHFHPVTAAELLRSRETGSALPANPVLVTFDDGYRNNLRIAAVTLREMKIPALFFVSTGYIGGKDVLWPMDLTSRVASAQHGSVPLPAGGEEAVPSVRDERRALAKRLRDQCKRLPAETTEAYMDRLRACVECRDFDEELNAFMTWDEVRELRRQGFEIGSHTVQHPILTRVSPGRLEQELAASKSAIERELGEDCPWIAYPNGGSEDVSREVFEAARRAGYKLGFTLRERRSRREEDDLALSRICVQGHLPLAYFRARASSLDSLFSKT